MLQWVLSWPGWRNWQTRTVQGRVPFRGVGSTPAPGTWHLNNEFAGMLELVDRHA